MYMDLIGFLMFPLICIDYIDRRKRNEIDWIFRINSLLKGPNVDLGPVYLPFDPPAIVFCSVYCIVYLLILLDALKKSVLFL